VIAETVELSGANRERVVAAAIDCIAARGLRRTTVEEIAAAAGVSRATLYRSFPGGRETILGAVVDAEIAGLLGSLEAVVAGAADLRATLVAGIAEAARFVATDPVIEQLLFEDPAVVLTHLEFEEMDRTLATASGLLQPYLARHLDAEAALRAGEWATRVVLSFLLVPDDEVDLLDRADVEQLVDERVLPGIVALSSDR
jgi:AcrR family transcriptional regulator